MSISILYQFGLEMPIHAHFVSSWVGKNRDNGKHFAVLSR